MPRGIYPRKKEDAGSFIGLKPENKKTLEYKITPTEAKELSKKMLLSKASDPLAKARQVLKEKREAGLVKSKRKKVIPRNKRKTALSKAISDGMKRAAAEGRKSGRKPKSRHKPVETNTHIIYKQSPQVKLGSRTRRPSLSDVSKAIDVLERAGLL